MSEPTEPAVTTEPLAPIVPFSSVIDAFLNSNDFLGKLALSSQKQYQRYLRLAQRGSLGRLPAEQVRPKHILAFLDGMADRPGAQRGAYTALKVLESFAAGPRELLSYPIMTGIKIVGTTGGHDPWTEAQIATAIKHARPDISRAIMLGAWTGQRISDLVKMAWTDIQENDGRLGIHVIQKKTKRELWIPFTRQLEEAIATWERRPAPLLLKPDGSRWTRNDLGMAWQAERRRNPKLADCRDLVFHGLRASACVRLRRRGASEAEIGAMVGMSIPMVSRYCRFADQKVNAMAAVHYLDGAWPNRERTTDQYVKRQK